MIDWCRAQQLGDHFLARTDRRGCDGALLEERPQPLADRRRQHAFEVFERRPPQMLVVGLEAAERDLQRFARQHQRQQREDVGEALAGAVAHERVERRLAR